MALLVLIPVVAPLAYLGVNIASQPEQVGETLTSGRTGELLVATVVLVVGVTVSATALGTATAWVTVRTDLGSRRLLFTLLALPLVIPSYVGALAYVAALGPRGMLSEVLAIDRLPDITGFPGAWLALTVFTYPYVHLLVASSLRRMDRSQEEAARSLGASPTRVFRTIVLPRIRPALAAGATLVALYTLSDFGAVSLMRYDAFTRAIYAQFAGRPNRVPALVLSSVLIVLALLVLLGERLARGRVAPPSTTTVKPPALVHLTSGWRVVAAVGVGAVIMIGVVVPVIVLGYWLGRGLAEQQALGSIWVEAGRSLLASGAAGVVAVLAAIPLCVLAVRYPSRSSALVERTSWVVYALPHITVGLAFLTLAARLGPPIYQSLALLVVAYVVLFLPQALGAGEAALRQIPLSLEEASRSLGKSWWSTLRRITVPLMGKGLIAGGALVFLTAMKELPATLLLRPTGFETLAVRIFAAASESLYTRASAAALVLLLVSAVPVYLLTIRRAHG
jgi:iron(III) transport system permease protein